MPIVVIIIIPPIMVSKVGCSLITNQTQIGPIWVWLVIKEQPTLETIIGGIIIITTIGIHSFLKLKEPQKINN